MPRRQHDYQSVILSFPTVSYDFAAVPNCVASRELGLQGSILEEVVNRQDWTSAVPELVGLSHEAASRRALKTGAFRGIHHNHAEAERLSVSFVSERTQTDDPIEGFMIRTKDNKQLQGFLWFTNFTTWTHFFRWDSLASKAELHGRAQRDGIRWDSDGSLSAELELQERSGDPNDQGVIWPRVAEIALVGGLECGGFLVQLALEALEQALAYDFVVVQATESSVGFYDRMGFRRVGALAKYITSDVAPHQARTVAYRHWAYPDEDVSKMDSSIMMAIKLRAGQVTKRILADEGGIYPHRHRFMERIPSRGVLANAPSASLSNRFQSIRGIVTGSEPSGSAPNGTVADHNMGSESVKDTSSRRNQACKPWVCYGNPGSAASVKRRKEGKANFVPRSSGHLFFQSLPCNAPSMKDSSPTAALPRILNRIRISDHRVCPRAPRGVCSSKRTNSGDPCISADVEPAGTEPEPDLLPADVPSRVTDSTLKARRDLISSCESDAAASPLPSQRPVAVAVRRFPQVTDRRDRLSRTHRVPTRFEANSAAELRAALMSNSKRFDRSRRSSALPKRAQQSECRTQSSQVRRSAQPKDLVDPSELGPLPMQVKPKEERVVPDLLSAAGVVSTKGPFDCEDEVPIPALAKSIKGSVAEVFDDADKELMERCTCFELMIAGEDHPCCDFCAKRKEKINIFHSSRLDDEEEIARRTAAAAVATACLNLDMEPCVAEVEEITTKEELEAEKGAQPQSKEAGKKNQGKDDEAEVGLARDRSPRMRVPVTKFRFHQVNVKSSIKKVDNVRSSDSQPSSHKKGGNKKLSRPVVKSEDDLSSSSDSADSSSDSESAVSDSKNGVADQTNSSSEDEKDLEAVKIEFPPYPWATEEDGDLIASSIWRPMQCPFAMVQDVVYATRGYDAVAPMAGKRLLVLSSTGIQRTADGESQENHSDESCSSVDEEEADVQCNGCGRADRDEHMILCDICDVGWHLDCLSPPLSAVPDGNWFCSSCLMKRKEKSSTDETLENSQENNAKRNHKKKVVKDNASLNDKSPSVERRCTRDMPLRNRQPVSRFKFHRTFQSSSVTSPMCRRQSADTGSDSSSNSRTSDNESEDDKQVAVHGVSVETGQKTSCGEPMRSNSKPQTDCQKSLSKSNLKEDSASLSKSKSDRHSVKDKICALNDTQPEDQVAARKRKAEPQTCEIVSGRKRKDESSIDYGHRNKDISSPLCNEMASVTLDRIDEASCGFWAKLRSETLRRVCEDVDSAVSGNRFVLISRIQARMGNQAGTNTVPEPEVLERLRMGTLRRLCADLSISIRGNKELVSCRLHEFLSSGCSQEWRVFSKKVSASPRDCDGRAKVERTQESHRRRHCAWEEWPCDGCGRADREEEMVLCDACDAGWHLDCLAPPLVAVPDGEWFCPECAADRASRSNCGTPSFTPVGFGSDASRKRVRYAMLGSMRCMERFELPPPPRTSRSNTLAKRQRVPVARFRFSHVQPPTVA